MLGELGAGAARVRQERPFKSINRRLVSQLWESIELHKADKRLLTCPRLGAEVNHDSKITITSQLGVPTGSSFHNLPRSCNREFRLRILRIDLSGLRVKLKFECAAIVITRIFVSGRPTMSNRRI
jgi:hypothetical protein